MASIVYQTPGVYIEEVLNGARPIQAVGTRTAGFVGVAPNARRSVNKAVAVNNWAEFVRRFATGDPPLTVLQQAVDDQVALEAHIKSAGNEVAKLSTDDLKTRKLLLDAASKSRVAADNEISAAASKIFPATKLSLAVYGFFLNGGSRCYVVNVGSDDSAPTADDLATTADNLATSANGLATTATALAKTANLRGKTATELTTFADTLATTADSLATTATDLAKTVDDLTNMAGVPPKTADDLAKTADRLVRTTNGLATTAKGLATTAGAPVKTTAALATTADELTKSAGELAKTAGVPPKTADDLAKTAKGLAKTAEDLAKTASVPTTTVDALATTATDLAKAATDLAKAAGDTAGTVSQLPKTTTALATPLGVQAKSEPRRISSRGSGKPVGLDILAQIDEVAIVAAPGYTGKDDYEDILNHCDNLKDRVGILDGPRIMDDNARQQLSGELLAAESSNNDSGWTRPRNSERGYGSLYVPWIEVSNPDVGKPSLNGSKEPETIMVPPSGHVAGVWARSDATRGVHKAPANEIVRGALGLARQITHEEQGILNQSGVNVIRYFPNEGYLIWGARTLTNQAAFRYLNVRRLFNMVEESIADSTRWIVFEPNDRPLWKAIRRDVTAFLMGFWRDGALMGRTPQEAFYVKCDEETNPIESIREGKVIIEVGLAPVLPAEFVIFRISQYEAGTEVEIQS